MKIQIISDLHLELGDYSLPPSDRNLLIIAGDININNKSTEFLKKQADICPVIYILGNHEYYYQEYNSTIQYYQRLKYPNLHFLHNSAVYFKNVRFLGCTLWTDINIVDHKKRKLLNSKIFDFQNIEIGDKLFTVEESGKIHKESITWLQNEIQNPFNGKTVVISHHLPSYMSVHPKYKGDPLNCAFASDLDDLISEFHPNFWIHGNTHSSFDYYIGKSRIICNPRGYPNSTNPSFNNALMINI